MIWISHRGNVNGSCPLSENKPEYLATAMSLGYDVEVDVWLTSDGFMLGHDAPVYPIDRHFFQNKKVWTHCKNAAAFIEFSKYLDVNCFMLDKDELALTSRGFIWADARCTEASSNTIFVCLNGEKIDPKAYGVCSDVRIQSNNDCCDMLPFSMLIVDIDGVMTDGTKMYDRNGSVFGKKYCDLDFTAIKRFISAGVDVIFLSGDKTVNEQMASTRKIPFFHNPPGIDKVDVLPKLRERTKGKIAYVGDDYYDIQIMRSVDLSFCPSGSPLPVKRAATHTLSKAAGNGVLASIYDMFEDRLPFAFPKDSPDVNPK